MNKSEVSSFVKEVSEGILNGLKESEQQHECVVNVAFELNVKGNIVTFSVPLQHKSAQTVE